jgi:ribosome maturation factor RimP
VLNQGVSDPESRLGHLEAALVPVVESHGLYLVDIEYHREGRRRVLRLFVDRPGGVSITDCQRLSHEAGDVLDVSGLIGESYDLEVSSPGLDRELRKDREFAWATGKDVRCWLRQPIDGRSEMEGLLIAMRPETLTLRAADGQTREVPRTLVVRARLVPDLKIGKK